MSNGRGGPATRTLLLAVLVGLLLGCGSGDEELRGRSSDPVPQVPALSLPDASGDGADFAIRADDGQLLLVYFGYTSCPDVCPTTLADVAAAMRLLADDAERVDLAMVTIDPERDGDEILKGYVQSFVPGSHALVTSDDARLRAVADAFGVTYAVELAPDGSTEVSHTSSVFVVDAEGRIPVVWPLGIPSEDMAHDLLVLLNRG